MTTRAACVAALAAAAWLAVVDPVRADPDDVAPARAAITDGWNDDGDDAVVALMRAGAVTCTGTVIRPDVVLTAAHCVDLQRPDRVVLGERPGRPDARVGVRGVVVHPGYVRAALLHDIAVVELAHDLDVTPARLPTGPIGEERIGSQVRIVGFGVPGRGLGGDLRKREGISRIDAIDHDRFRLEGVPSQACLGDSGGPTFLQVGDAEPLVGVHSGGSASCTGGSIETRVDAHLAFLGPHLARRGAPAACSASSAGRPVPSVIAWVLFVGALLSLRTTARTERL